MSDDLCYFCGKDVGGMYTYYWGNKCHIECEPEYAAKKKTADEIALLRERLEQAERERDEAADYIGRARLTLDTGAITFSCEGVLFEGSLVEQVLGLMDQSLRALAAQKGDE